MKVLVLSDVHGNLDALESVLLQAQLSNWQEIWFLGDLGGYGPQPDECFQLLKSHKIVFLPGNHDLYYAGVLSRNVFSREALQALLLTRSKIRKEYIDIMKAIPVIQRRKGITLVHGSLVDPKTDYIINIDDAEKNFKILKGNCCLFGHTHIQGCFIQENKITTWFRPSSNDLIKYKGKKILINPGSVGQPRDKDPRAAWAILDTSKKEVQFFRTEYIIENVQNKMRKMGSSEFLINRLETGV